MAQCDQHGDLMRILGEIDGRTKKMEEELGELSKIVTALTVTGEVQRAKLGPVFWTLAVFGNAAILGFVGFLFAKLMGE